MSKLCAEDFICAVCRNYLYRTPIFVLPNGHDVCESCSLANSETKAHRRFSLEKLLCSVQFPCQQKSYGCNKTLLFNKAAEHDYVCQFIQIRCTFHVILNCDWKGSVGEFKGHVLRDHPFTIRNRAMFKIDLDSSSNDTFTVITTNNDFFMVSYRYDQEKKSLYHNLAFYIFEIEKQFCKIQFINASNTAYMIEMEGCECVHYYDGLLDVTSGTTIDLADVLQNLNYPTSVSVNLIFNDVNENETSSYTTLNTNRCYICNYYLILPIFQTGDKFICNDCHYNVECDAVSSESDLSCRLANLNYPCRWDFCNKVLKGNLIGDHETKCAFRIYHCIHCSSNWLISKSLISEHLTASNVKYFGSDSWHTIKLGDESLALYMFVKDEFVQVKVLSLKSELSYYSVSYLTTSKDKNKIKCTVQFTHINYWTTCNEFVVDPQSTCAVSLQDLPSSWLTNEERYVIICLY